MSYAFTEIGFVKCNVTNNFREKNFVPAKNQMTDKKSLFMSI